MDDPVGLGELVGTLFSKSRIPMLGLGFGEGQVHKLGSYAKIFSLSLLQSFTRSSAKFTWQITAGRFDRR